MPKQNKQPLNREFSTGAKEIWKDIINYENLYQVSSFGNIKSIKNNKILKQGISWNYLRIKLYKDNKGKSYSVHRIVAENFIKNKKNKPIINHKDGNKQNNNVKNLEWATYKENQKHAFRTGLNRSCLIYGKETRFKEGSIPWNKRLDDLTILKLRKDGNTLKEIALKLDYSIAGVHYSLNKNKLR